MLGWPFTPGVQDICATQRTKVCQRKVTMMAAYHVKDQLIRPICIHTLDTRVAVTGKECFIRLQTQAVRLRACLLEKTRTLHVTVKKYAPSADECTQPILHG